MQYKENLRSNEQFAYKIIRNSFNNGTVNNCYLFSGSHTSELNDAAYYLIEEIINMNNHNNENWVKASQYSSLFVIDGLKGVVKKSEVIDVIDKMSYSSLEKHNIKIMLIHGIEFGNKHSLNSLLKFIEETSPNTYVILTTKKIGAVLDTIKSRSQVIRISPYKKSFLFEHVASLDKINKDVANVLLSITRDVNEINHIINSSQINLYDKLLTALTDSVDKHNDFINTFFGLLNKTNIHISLKFLIAIFIDVVRVKNNIDPINNSRKNDLKKMENINTSFAIDFIESKIKIFHLPINFNLQLLDTLTKLGFIYE